MSERVSVDFSSETREQVDTSIFSRSFVPLTTQRDSSGERAPVQPSVFFLPFSQSPPSVPLSLPTYITLPYPSSSSSFSSSKHGSPNWCLRPHPRLLPRYASSRSRSSHNGEACYLVSFTFVDSPLPFFSCSSLLRLSPNSLAKAGVAGEHVFRPSPPPLRVRRSLPKLTPLRRSRLDRPRNHRRARSSFPRGEEGHLEVYEGSSGWCWIQGSAHRRWSGSVVDCSLEFPVPLSVLEPSEKLELIFCFGCLLTNSGRLSICARRLLRLERTTVSSGWTRLSLEIREFELTFSFSLLSFFDLQPSSLDLECTRVP